jgi:hypothetical protein
MACATRTGHLQAISSTPALPKRGVPGGQCHSGRRFRSGGGRRFEDLEEEGGAHLAVRQVEHRPQVDAAVHDALLDGLAQLAERRSEHGT